METLSTDIPTPFVVYIDAAIARLGYLYPDVEWSSDPDKCRVEAQYSPDAWEAENLRKELLFQLYREKIQSDTSGIRHRMYEAIGK